MGNEAGAAVLGVEQPGNTDVTPPSDPSGENGFIPENNDQLNPNEPAPNDLDAPGLSEDNAAFLQSKGYKGVEDFDKVVTSYNELEKLHSSAIITPETDDFTSPDWDKFGKRVGALDTADAYSFEAPPDLPDNVVYDASLSDDFKPIAHKYKLTVQQAKGIHDDFSGVFANRQVDQFNGQNDSIKQAGQNLANEYGGSANHPQFQQAMTDAFKSMNATPGLIDAYVRKGILVEIPGKPGQYNPTDETVVMAHASHGAALMNEPGDFDIPKGNQNNPFAADTLNLTEQGKIIRSNPKTARALVIQAGKDPKLYQL